MTTDGQGIGQYDNNHNSYQPTYEKDDAYSNSYPNSYNYYHNQPGIMNVGEIHSTIFLSSVEFCDAKHKKNSMTEKINR